MNTKLTGYPFSSLACVIISYTFSLMLSKSGLKKLYIIAGGKSIELAPRCFSYTGSTPFY